METRSKWEDTGYDCNLCGGQIFKRTDEELTGVVSYYQCQRCGAQWSLNNQLIREGDRSKHFRPDQGGGLRERNRVGKLPGWVWLILGLLAMFMILRAGVIAALLVRFLIPTLFLVIVGIVIYRLGREMQWW